MSMCGVGRSRPDLRLPKIPRAVSGVSHGTSYIIFGSSNTDSLRGAGKNAAHRYKA